MNREQMIGRAETVVKDSARRIQNGWTQRAVAAVIVEALLPQVTTAAELVALPSQTYLRGDDGSLWKAGGSGYFICEQGRVDHFVVSERGLAENYGPLTVVWQP